MNPKITLVLAGGGLRALSCIPLFNFLDKEKIKVNSMVGSSGGALLSCCYAMGLSGDQITETAHKMWRKEVFQQINLRAILGLLDLPFGIKDEKASILKADRMLNAFGQFFGEKRLEDLSIPCFVHTTNFKNAQEETLSKGLLREVVYASSADYPFLPPIKIEDKWLVDGSFSAPLPILPALKFCQPDLIIALMYDVSEICPQGFLEYYYSFFSQLHTIHRKTQVGFGINISSTEIVLIRIRCKGLIKMWDTHKIPEILEIAEQEIESKKSEIIHAINLYKS